MRAIIFKSQLAADTRRLGATIDVESSQIKFLGGLRLDLWDCGGQDCASPPLPSPLLPRSLFLVVLLQEVDKS